jgi:hypothetical protein
MLRLNPCRQRKTQPVLLFTCIDRSSNNFLLSNRPSVSSGTPTMPPMAFNANETKRKRRAGLV